MNIYLKTNSKLMESKLFAVDPSDRSHRFVETWTSAWLAGMLPLLISHQMSHQCRCRQLAATELSVQFLADISRVRKFMSDDGLYFRFGMFQSEIWNR